MKKTLRIVGILLIIIAIIFALVTMGLLHFNYFTLLANGTAVFKHDAFTEDEVVKIEVNVPKEIVEYCYSDDDKIHFSYINSDKFYYNITVDQNKTVKVELTDNIEWYDYFSLYTEIAILISVPKDTNVEIYENNKKIPIKFEHNASKIVEVITTI